ncbi:MAG: PaaI family thioesterase [Acidobacteriota bacterium]|nr:PaaI family thioesterase [Acidobacteriota bacterium]
MYERAPCNAHVRPQMTIGHGTAELRIPVRPEFFHAAGAVHGSYYFKALDDAAFFAANSLVEDVFLLTASFTTQLLRPVAGGTLVARGSVVRAGRALIFADAVLADEAGVELAHGTGVFARSAVKLEERIGYR